MTKDEYIEGKKANLQDFVNDNEQLIRLGALKNMDNLKKTLRMIDKAKKIIAEIDNGEYWNVDRECYYKIIYQHTMLINRKQDIALF